MPQMTVWRMRIPRWLLEATNAHSKYVILTVFPLQQWLHCSASMLRYTDTACLVKFSRHSSAQCLETQFFVCFVSAVRFIVTLHFDIT